MSLEIQYTEAERLLMEYHRLAINRHKQQLKESVQKRKAVRDRARARTVREIAKEGKT